jgi:hypothetical protein
MRFLVLGLCVALATTLTSPEASALDIFPIALSDWQVPGGPAANGTIGYVANHSLSMPNFGANAPNAKINDRGQIAFSTEVNIPDSFNSAIWMWENGSITQVAATSNVDPASPYKRFYNVQTEDVHLNANGQILIGGETNESTPRRFLKTFGGSFELHEFDPAPGTPAGTVFGIHPDFLTYNYSRVPFTDVDFNDNGEATFFSLLNGPSVTTANDESFWSTAGGSLHLMAREGQPLPAFGSQATVGALRIYFGELLDAFDSNRMTSLSNSGESWFTLPILNGTVSAATFRTSPGGTLQPFIYDGVQAEVGTTFAGAAEFGEFSVNDAGQALFYASFRRGAAAPKNGLWNYDGNEFHLLAEYPGPVPGLPGISYSQYPSDITLAPSSQGALVYTTPLTPSSDAVWFGSPDNIELKLLAGGPASGIPGATFIQFGSPAIANDNGNLIFRGTFRHPSAPTANKRGLWLMNPQGEVELIAATGSVMEVGPGDFRTIVDYWEGETSPYCLTDSMFVFWTRFEDGTSGLFAISLVPEPTSLMLLGVLLTAVVSSRHSCRSTAPSKIA